MSTGTNIISSTAIIYPNVILGKNIIIEDFCVIGYPFKGFSDEKTIIDDNSIIRAGTYIYAGNKIGNNFQTGNKANIRELNQIGNNVSIGTLTVVEHHVSIEDNARIHTQAFIPEFTEIKKDAWIGPNVVFTNAKFPKSPDVKSNLKGAIVQENAKIGANTTILPNIIIGKNSLIGAGSLVTKDVKDNSIYFGHPAVYIRSIDY